MIVPTRGDRSVLLRRQLKLLRAQLRDGDEILVSLDGTPQPRWLENAGAGVIVGPAGGPGVARNRALERSRGDLFVFLNDDAIPDSGLLERHRRAHEERSASGLSRAIVVGDAPWAVREDDRPLDRMLRHTSLVFFYDQMRRGGRERDWGYRHAWTLNLSVPRELCQRFDERLRFPMLDDLEWAYRVTRASGVPVIFRPEARVLHEHRYSALDVLIREVLLGHQAATLRAVNPECARIMFADRLTGRVPVSGAELLGAGAAFRVFESWCGGDGADPQSAFEACRGWRETARRFGASRCDEDFGSVRRAALELIGGSAGASAGPSLVVSRTAGARSPTTA